MNLLRVAIRNECDIASECASGNYLDRVRVLEGADHCVHATAPNASASVSCSTTATGSPARRYVSGDVTPASNSGITSWADSSMPRITTRTLSRAARAAAHNPRAPS